MDIDSRVFISRMGVMAEMLLIKSSQMTKYQIFNVFKLVLVSVLLSLMIFRTSTVILYLCIIITIVVMLSYLIKYYDSNFCDIDVRYNSNDILKNKAHTSVNSAVLSDDNVKIDKNKLKQYRETLKRRESKNL